MDVVGVLGAQPSVSAYLRAPTQDYETGGAEGTFRPERVGGAPL